METTLLLAGDITQISPNCFMEDITCFVSPNKALLIVAVLYGAPHICTCYRVSCMRIVYMQRKNSRPGI